MLGLVRPAREIFRMALSTEQSCIRASERRLGSLQQLNIISAFFQLLCLST